MLGILCRSAALIMVLSLSSATLHEPKSIPFEWLGNRKLRQAASYRFDVVETDPITRCDWQAGEANRRGRINS